MFIKKFYLKLLNDYFTGAAFAKPTGDGLLLIFRYSESDLLAVSEHVLKTCFKVMDDFPSMFTNDPMINFPTPEKVGFGISRGPSCCLFSGRTIIDYSGQLLNLAARLNDLARPMGVVIAGSYLRDVIPNFLRSRFTPKKVYVRGIAEEEPIEVLCSTPDVDLPSHCLQPLVTHDWKVVERKMTISGLRHVSGNFVIALPEEPLRKENTKLSVAYENPDLPGCTTNTYLKGYTISKDASGHSAKFRMAQARRLLEKAGLSDDTAVVFRFQYVPKARPPASKRVPRKHNK